MGFFKEIMYTVKDQGHNQFKKKMLLQPSLHLLKPEFADFTLQSQNLSLKLTWGECFHNGSLNIIDRDSPIIGKIHQS